MREEDVYGSGGISVMCVDGVTYSGGGGLCELVDIFQFSHLCLGVGCWELKCEESNTWVRELGVTRWVVRIETGS